LQLFLQNKGLNSSISVIRFLYVWLQKGSWLFAWFWYFPARSGNSNFAEKR